MTPIYQEMTLSQKIQPLVGTTVAGDGGLASTDRDQRTSREGWERMIDEFLVEWGKNPAQLHEEGIVPPSRSVIQTAIELAMKNRDAEGKLSPPPLRVVPDGEGGISFEFRTGTVFRSLDIHDDGSIELLTFKDCRLQSRECHLV